MNEMGIFLKLSKNSSRFKSRTASVQPYSQTDSDGLVIHADHQRRYLSAISWNIQILENIKCMNSAKSSSQSLHEFETCLFHPMIMD